MLKSVKKLRTLARNMSKQEIFDPKCSLICHYADEIEQEVSERYMPLPVDADGVPIRVGDKLDGYGKTITVTSMRYERFGWILISGEGGGFHDCSAFTHYHKPTVEDVLAEMLDAWDKLPSNVTNEAIIAEFAAKLRLAGDGDER